MRWDAFSRVVPMLSGAALIGAGAFQFTRWKLTGLLRCRSPFGCITSCPEREASRNQANSDTSRLRQRHVFHLPLAGDRAGLLAARWLT